MGAATWLIIISAIIPLMRAGSTNRSTSLIHAIGWAMVAWCGWLVSAVAGSLATAYLALVLSGCVGIAVLGARRPGVGGWNFVVGGLLAVLTVPLAEAFVLDTPVRLGMLRTVFLACLLGVTVINYLPTRLFFGAVLLGIGCGLELAWLVERQAAHEQAVCCIGLAPWLAWLGLRLGPKATSECDRLWRRFRDRFGLIWSLRVREQFNHASLNAGRNVELHWTGVRVNEGTPAAGEAAAFACETLMALTRRFDLS